MQAKKSLLALAVAGAIAAPHLAMADTSIYGRLRAGILAGDTDTDMTNLSSRFGVKSSHDIGNGVSVVGRYEWGAQGDEAGGAALSTRIARLGFDFGGHELHFGQMWQPMYNHIYFLDYNATWTANAYYAITTAPTRTGNFIKYAGSSGDLSWSLGIGVGDLDTPEDPDKAIKEDLPSNDPGSDVKDDDIPLNNPISENEDINQFQGGISYSTDAFTIGASFRQINGDTLPRTQDKGTEASDEDGDAFDQFSVAASDIDNFGLGGLFNLGAAELGFLYQTEDAGDGEDKDSIDLSVSFKAGANTFRVQLGQADLDSGDDEDFISLSAIRKLSDQSRIFFLVLDTDADVNDANDSTNAIAGWRYDF